VSVEGVVSRETERTNVEVFPAASFAMSVKFVAPEIVTGYTKLPSVCRGTDTPFIVKDAPDSVLPVILNVFVLRTALFLGKETVIVGGVVSLSFIVTFASFE